MTRTPSQTIGPFFAVAYTFPTPAHFGGAAGVGLSGVVTDGAGATVTDALVEMFDGRHLARCCTDTDGRFAFVVPLDAVRAATPPDEAPHLAVTVFARGLLAGLTTRCYLPDDDARLAADTFLAAVPAERRATLIATDDDDGLRFDIRLQGEGETVFRAG